MKKRHVVLALIAGIVGFFIFFISLIIGSQNDVMDSERVSERTFYIGRLLPDHVLYPVVMLFDRGLLILSSGEKEVAVRMYLAQDRMSSAQQLLEKGEEQLALSTLTKSQKYLILAAHQFLQLDDFSQATQTELLRALQVNTQKLTESKSRFSVVDTAPIDDLVVESKTLISLVSAKHVK